MITERKLEGHWWGAESPDVRAAGTLSITRRGSITLNLNGSFGVLPPWGMPPTIPIILGVTDQEPVTLFDCIPTHREGSLYQSISYHVGHAYIGEHVREGDSATFREISLSLDHILEWTRSTDLRYAASPPPNDNGSVGGATWFVWEHGQDAARDSVGLYEIAKSFELVRKGNFVSITEMPHFKVVSHNRIDLSQITSRILSPLRDLVAFACDAAVAPTKVTLTHDTAEDGELGSTRSASAELVREFVAPPSYGAEQIDHRDMLFALPEYPRTFGELLDNWYRLTELAGSVINVLVGNLYGPPAFVDNRLLLFLLAAEAYHRTMLLDQQVDEENTKQRKNVLDSCPPESLEWLELRFSHAGDPGYRRRLKDLIRRTSPAIDPLVPKVGPLADELYKVRNEFAHSAAMPETLTGSDAYALATRIQWVLKANVLLDLGFAISEISSVFGRNRKFAHAVAQFAK